MIMVRQEARVCLAMLLASAALLADAPAAAQTKEACLDAHGKGQDLRDSGKLSDAREQFLKCAQASCPSLVQSDCARFGEELSRVVPTVTFVARDGQGRDLTDVTVFVDDVQVATTLSGKSFELDPGARNIRFVYEGKTLEQKVVISQGEKGRTIAMTFEGQSQPASASQSTSDAPSASVSGDQASGPSRSALPLVVAGVGAVTAVVGGILIGVGAGDVPENCDFFDKECTAAPGDPVFEDAKSAAGTVNLGVALTAGGVAVMGIGLIWYFAQDPSKPAAPTTGRVWSPWFTGKSGGLAFRSAF